MLTFSNFRHRRIHEPRADGDITNIDEDDEEREFGDIPEDSPREERSFLPQSIQTHSPISTHGLHHMGLMNVTHTSMSMTAPSQMIHPHQQILQG